MIPNIFIHTTDTFILDLNTTFTLIDDTYNYKYISFQSFIYENGRISREIMRPESLVCRHLARHFARILPTGVNQHLRIGRLRLAADQRIDRQGFEDLPVLHHRHFLA